MPAKQPDRHQLAVAILAIATAAIGFGLFGGDVEIHRRVAEGGVALGFQRGKLIGILVSGMFYVLVLWSVSRILRGDRVTGRQLADGPLLWLYMEMVSLGGLYLLTVLEELIGN